MKYYKRIPFSGMKNCRDLGGYVCGKHGLFQYHRLYRSDVPVNLTEEEWKKIYYEMTVRTIVDLRSSSEIQQMNYQVPKGIQKVELPLLREEIDLRDMLSMEKSTLDAFGRSLQEGYTTMVRENTRQVALVLQTIGEALDYGAVLYHCSAGKDRTGVITALIYLLCQVAEEDIIADYQVTATYLSGKKIMVQELPEELKALMTSAPEAMEEFLRTAREEKFLEKLYQEGLRPETVEVLRQHVIEGD